MKYTKKRILLAGPCHTTEKKKNLHTDFFDYDILYVQDAQEVKLALSSFSPDLICISLPLEGVHGLSLIKTLRSSPAWCDMGIFIMVREPFPHALITPIASKINKLLPETTNLAQLLPFCDLFFQGALPLTAQKQQETKSKQLTKKEARSHSYSNYLKFWGTRGSSPVSGVEYLHFGGNTSCCEIKYEDTHIILDAGTGIRAIPYQLGMVPAEIHLFLTHLHWDHIVGLPFFKYLYQPECTLHFWIPQSIENHSKQLIEKIFSATYFPVQIEEMAASLYFHEVCHQSQINLGPIKISTHYAYHPGETVCFKIHTPKEIIGYAPDNELFLGYTSKKHTGAVFHNMCELYQPMIEFFSECSLLIHEAQYTTQEYEHHLGWGHSSIQNITHFCKASAIKNLLITHHDPTHTDQDLDKMLIMLQQCFQEIEHSCHVALAFDGMEVSL